MPVLKSTSSPIQPRTFSLRDVETQAAGIIAQARQQAEAILKKAAADAEAIKQAARAEGLAEGRAAGSKAGMEQGIAAGRQQAISQYQQELSKLVQALTEVAEQIERSRLRLLAGADEDVVCLAIEIARKVVGARGLTDVNVVLGSVREALRFVIGHNDVRIAVHPSQQVVLQEALPAMRLAWPNLQHVQIVADDTILPGGARVHTRNGEVDATLDTMIDRIAAELLGKS
jgi:flagellar assembly protein FliH